GGADQVNIGNAGSVQQIGGTVTILNAPSLSTITVDDSADGVARTVTHDTFTPAGDLPHGRITGLAPAVIQYRYNDALSVTVQGGTAGNTFNVLATGSTALTLNAGNGADTVNVRANTGAVTVNGGGSDDTVTVGSVGNTINANLGAISVNGG